MLVTEIMGNSLRTRETIIYGESENKSFHEIIEAGSTLGWHTFDQSLIAAVQAGIVTEETAMVSCTNKGKVRQELDLIQKRFLLREDLAAVLRRGNLEWDEAQK